jgi:hypothetical protein
LILIKDIFAFLGISLLHFHSEDVLFAYLQQLERLICFSSSETDVRRI